MQPRCRTWLPRDVRVVARAGSRRPTQSPGGSLAPTHTCRLSPSTLSGIRAGLSRDLASARTSEPPGGFADAVLHRTLVVVDRPQSFEAHPVADAGYPNGRGFGFAVCDLQPDGAERTPPAKAICCGDPEAAAAVAAISDRWRLLSWAWDGRASALRGRSRRMIG